MYPIRHADCVILHLLRSIDADLRYCTVYTDTLAGIWRSPGPRQRIHPDLRGVDSDRDGERSTPRDPCTQITHLLFSALAAFASLCSALPLVCSG